jgi:GT2 family glycosyltransferase
MNIYVVSPTYKKFDLCANMIESGDRSTRKPNGYVILDNGAGNAITYWKEHNPEMLQRNDTEILVAPCNLGCAAGWNVLLRHMQSKDEDAYVIVVNDDIEFYEDAIEKFEHAFSTGKDFDIVFCGDGLGSINAFSMFGGNPKRMLGTIGPFDESIIIAYTEDNDYFYRMQLLGYDLVRIPGCGAKHNEDGSATIKSFTREEMQMHHHRFNRNMYYYEKKWGGKPHNETYIVPFNGQNVMNIMMEIYQQFRM